MLSYEQRKLLRSRFVDRATFQVLNVLFECYEGEWAVIKDGEHVGVFTFSRYSENDLDQTIHDIFYNTEKVEFI